MTQKELEALEQIVEKLQAINSKLDEFIQKMDSVETKPQTESDELKSRGIVNGLLHICTHPGFEAKEYCNALHQLKELDFTLSPKQVAWILCYTYRHPDCGDSIQAYLTTTLKRVKDKQKFVDTIAFELRKNYANEKNGEFIEGVISHIKSL